MKKYRQKNTPDGLVFDTIQGNIVIPVDTLNEHTGDPVELFTKAALAVAADMLNAWEAAKNDIEPVEGE
jgi:hypothetical protein